MKIQLFSDLHLETGPFVTDSKQADVVVAAGDIDEGLKGLAWLCQLDRPVIYVPGNHEFYDGFDLFERREELRAACAGTNVHVLDDGIAVIDGVRFVGGTLWTSYGGWNPVLVQYAWLGLNDYRRIRADSWYTSANIDYLTSVLRDFGVQDNQWIDELIATRPYQPIIAYELHRETRAFLEDTLAQPFDGPTVVVTHHAPSYDSLAETGYPSVFLRPECWTWGGMEDPNELFRPAAYASDLSDIISRHCSDIALWLHGHIHYAVDYRLNGVRIASNPRGYHRKAISDAALEMYLTMGVSISDDEAAESRRLSAEDPYRGNTPNFDRHKLLEVEFY